MISSLLDPQQSGLDGDRKVKWRYHTGEYVDKNILKHGNLAVEWLWEKFCGISSLRQFWVRTRCLSPTSEVIAQSQLCEAVHAVRVWRYRLYMWKGVTCNVNALMSKCYLCCCLFGGAIT